MMSLEESRDCVTLAGQARTTSSDLAINVGLS